MFFLTFLKHPYFNFLSIVVKELNIGYSLLEVDIEKSLKLLLSIKIMKWLLTAHPK